MSGTGNQEEAGDETVRRQRRAAEVLWRYCDGRTSPELVTAMLTGELGDWSSDDFVWRALEQVQDALQLARAVSQPRAEAYC